MENISGEILKNALRAHNLTQDYAAKSLNVSRQTINTWCKAASLESDIIERITENLFIDLREFKNRTTSKTNMDRFFETEVEMMKDKLILTYEKMIKELEDKVEGYKNEVRELQEQMKSEALTLSKKAIVKPKDQK